MGNELLSIGLSGLLTSQRGLSTTAHNVANSNTAGYSRQRVELNTRPAQWSGGVYLGAGANVADITRSYDQFLTREVQLSTSTAAEYRTKYELAAELDALLGTAETGLSEPLQGFFNAIEDAAADPTSLTARQLLLDQGEQLANRFQSLDSRLAQIGDGIESRARAASREINDLATSIASLNAEMLSSRGTSGQPNDLLDQRDELLRQLSEHVSVTTLTQDDGALNVYIGSGQPLVMGSQARELTVVTPDGPNADPTGIGILLRQPGAAGVEVTSEIHGGTLGALLDVEQGMLKDAQRQLGQIALGVAEQVNAQHQMGMDLNGNLGGLFFSDVNASGLQTARATGDGSNTGPAVLQIPVTSVGDLKNSDYRLSYDGSNYSLVRESDNALIATDASLANISAAAEDEGFQIQVQSGTIAAGDRFTLRPTASALRLFEVAVSDSRSLALAAPIRSAMSSANLGDASIGSVSVGNLAGTPLTDAITLTYDANTNELIVSAPPGGTLPYNPSTDSGAEQTLNVPTFGDIGFSISGIPLDGDSFTLQHNAGGAGDNSNALLLADLQTRGVLSGGSATFAEGYSSTVSDVASRTSSFERASTTQAELLRRAEDSRATYSGVNLDEEAANILRYQQAYEASARVVSVANELFQTLIRAFGG